MARPRKSGYTLTVFAKRITELQKKNGYSNNYIVEHVLDKYGLPLCNSIQTYNTWKLGSRLPGNFQDAIIAFADFYGVSVEYMIREDAPETPQIKSVQDATGLSTESIRNIMSIQSDYPYLMSMIDSILSFSRDESITYLLNLYNQIYSDYKDTKNENVSASYDLEKMQQRLLTTQQAYSFISTIVTNNLKDDLDKQILKEQDEIDYIHSDEFINNLDPLLNNSIIRGVEFSYPDGKKEVKKAEKH